MATAAYNVSVVVHTAAGAGGNTLNGINDISFSLSRNIVDISDMIGSADFTKRLATLKDFPISLSGQYLPADAAYVTLKNSFSGLNDAFIRIFTDSGATTGFEVQVVVESIELSFSPDGAQEVSISLQSTSNVTFLP